MNMENALEQMLDFIQFRRLMGWATVTAELIGLPDEMRRRLVPDLASQEPNTPGFYTRLLLHGSPAELNPMLDQIQQLDGLLRQVQGEKADPKLRVHACPMCLAEQACRMRGFFHLQDWIASELDNHAEAVFKEHKLEGYKVSCISKFEPDVTLGHSADVKVHAVEGQDACTDLAVAELRSRLRAQQPAADWEVSACPDCANSSDHSCLSLAE